MKRIHIPKFQKGTQKAKEIRKERKKKKENYLSAILSSSHSVTLLTPHRNHLTVIMTLG
jgi:hypothetical protein